MLHEFRRAFEEGWILMLEEPVRKLLPDARPAIFSLHFQLHYAIHP
jgi:hypothetical protein